MKTWNELASKEVIQKTIENLQAHGISAEVVETGDIALHKALGLIPDGSEVMTMTSMTNTAIGINKEIDESGKYNSIRKRLMTLDRKTQHLEMQKLGAAPEYTIGSVNAVTQEGSILMASNTGSQLSAYVYGSAHVIWVVGAQKIVENTDAGIKRIYDYVLPKESERARAAYGLPDSFHSNVSKLLIINKEVNPTRLHIIFVKEVLGF